MHWIEIQHIVLIATLVALRSVSGICFISNAIVYVVDVYQPVDLSEASLIFVLHII